MRWIMLALLLTLALPARAQVTFRVCTDYPNQIATDLSDAKAELIRQHGLKPTVTNGEVQAAFVMLGIRQMLEAVVRRNESDTIRNAVLTRWQGLETAFPNPAPKIVCGDAVLDAGEECDTGASRSDTTPNACRTTCLLAFCGDSVTDTGEICDDGRYGACKDDCSGSF